MFFKKPLLTDTDLGRKWNLTRYEKEKEKRLEYQKEYYQKHRDELKQRSLNNYKKKYGLKENAMKTYELQSLLTEENKQITIPGEIAEVFENWKTKVKEAKKKDKIEILSCLEIFYAGYIMSNPIVREQFKNPKEKEIEDKYN